VPRPRPPIADRIAARIVTGPAGHLYAGVADWAGLLARYLWARLRRRPVEPL
jgi:hypothetical protein